MCLSTVSLNLERKRVGNKLELVGTGYKVMGEYEIKGMMGKWCKAKPWNGTKLECASDSTQYYPGFHIWVNATDAKAYLGKTQSLKIYQVLFREVICIGSNYCRLNNKPCVVANWIKYEEEINPGDIV